MQKDHATPVYFDCDTGIDDSLALLLLARQTALSVEGIGAVSGNVSAAQGARNTLDLLPLIGLEAPVAIGQHEHLTRPFSGGSGSVHGQTGTGRVTLPRNPANPIELDAADLLIELAHKHRGSLKVIAVGPLTNLAIALQRDPSLSSMVRDVTVMGGAALVPGNITPAAEANIYNDPEAAAIVFDAPWPITVVGLDVTMQHRLTEEDRLTMLNSGSPGAVVVAEMIDHYLDFYVGIYGERSCALHDPLAVAIAAGMVDVVDAPIVAAEIDLTDGPDRGRTVYDLRGRFRGYPAQEGSHVSVVLSLGSDFAPVLIGHVA